MRTNAYLGLSVLLDCDGVLLDSNDLKNNAFAECLSHYPPSALEAFLSFQRASFGRSRYVLFEIFFQQFLNREPLPGELQSLLSRFSEICQARYADCSLIPGTVETLEALTNQGVPTYVVSGSDQAELRLVLEKVGLARFFQAIYGSPKSKMENIAHIKSSMCDASRIVFVGDASADYEAAMATGCEFVYLSPWAADPVGMQTLKTKEGFPEITSLTAAWDYWR